MTELSPKLRGRLTQIEARHDELGRAMSDPAVTGDRDRLRAVGQEYAQLEAIVDTIRRLHAAEKRVADARELQEGDDADLRDLAREDEGAASLEVDRLTERLRTQLIPRDPLDEYVMRSYATNRKPLWASASVACVAVSGWCTASTA